MVRSKAYQVMFADYPDVVNINQMTKMLGGIGRNTGYALIQSGRIKAMRIGKAYRIPKVLIIDYLLTLDDQRS